MPRIVAGFQPVSYLPSTLSRSRCGEDIRDKPRTVSLRSSSFAQNGPEEKARKHRKHESSEI